MHLVINGWFAGQQSNGSGQYLGYLLPEIVKQAPAMRISVLVPDLPITQEVMHHLPAGVEVVRLALPGLPRQVAKLYWEQWMVPTMVRRLRADLLWVPYWASPWWQPCPTVVTVHDVISLILPAYQGGLLQRAYSRLVSHTARRSSAILTVSQASKLDIVRQLGVADGQVHVVYHGPNQPASPIQRPPLSDNTSDKSDTEIRAKYRLPARYFLYLGGFDVRKNVRSVLAAYQRYLTLGGDAAVKLVIAGKLPAKHTAFFPHPEVLAQEFGFTAGSPLASQLHFCGWVDEADKAALYAGAVTFIFPSEYEGFGMMLLEAMAAGTPVVTSAE